MAIRIQSLPKKNFGQPNCNVSFPSWWSFNELQIPQKLESPPQLCHEAKYLGLQLSDQDSSSTQSIGQSHSEIGAISSESGGDGSCGKGVEEKMKPVFLFSSSSSEISFNPSQADHNSHPMARAPHLYADPHFGGLFSPYGPQAAIVQPQMVGMTSARLPLPLDLADDGPIYVNAKQYHGILRRRQTRAKLEAQNKLVKARKPYLHESRHRHALNRVRGSGGRFLSTKKVQQTDTAPNPSRLTVSDSIHLHHKNSGLELESCRSGAGQSGASNASCSDVTSVSNGEILFPKPQEHRFSAISTHVGGGMQDNVGLVRGATQHRASVVR